MSRTGMSAWKISESFPRVSGDEPDLRKHGHERVEFSPRERG